MSIKLKIKNKQYDLISNPLGTIIREDGYNCNAISLLFNKTIEEVLAIGFEDDVTYSVIDDNGEHDLSNYSKVVDIIRHEKKGYCEVVMSEPNALEDALSIIDELI